MDDLDSVLDGVRVLDGGLATELEARGHDLDHPLWSAHLLADDPEAIRAVHRDYLDAGADCVIAASYQASFEGLAANGFSPAESRELLTSSVRLACEARDAFIATSPSDRSRPRVAASVGPYGAYLADGSEYRGRYGVSASTLHAFHAERLRVLWAAGPDLLAIETLPDIDELRVLLALLSEMPGPLAWISFSCRDGEHLSDGTPIAEAAALCAGSDAVAAVGVNCTAPRHVGSLIDQLRAGAPALPVIVYPNSGERYDIETRSWTGTSEPVDFGHAAVSWRRRGATIIGGCCRTGPRHITAIRRALDSAE